MFISSNDHSTHIHSNCFWPSYRDEFGLIEKLFILFKVKSFNFADETDRNLWNWRHTFTISDARHSLLLNVLHLTRTEVFKEFTFQTFLANTLHYKCSSQNLKSCPPYCSQTFSYWCNVSFPFLCLRLHRKLFDFSVRIAKQTRLYWSAWIISSKLFELHPWCIQRLLIPYLPSL